jgi:alpha-tubulin suppressor-like RCC1 family protein
MPRVEIAPVLLATTLTLAACGEDVTAPTDPTASSSVVAAAAAATWTQVAVGGQHTCALASNGGAYCWGYAVWGQIGNGTAPIKLPNPTRVSGNLKFVQITAGLTHTCAITGDNKAYCWGSGGLLGSGTDGDRSVPTPIAGSRRFSQIRAGASHTCALTPAGKAFCWGLGGLLGDGTNTSRSVPVAVKGGLTFRRIVAGGRHTCAVTTGDKAYCWGRGEEGQLGQGTTSGSTKPVAVSGGLSFQFVVAGSDHTCGVTTTGQGYCWGGWGSDLYNGQLGNGDASQGRMVPTAISGGRKWRQIIAGHLHTCGVTQTDVPFCWGLNFDGQNGDGTTVATSVPTRVAGNLKFIGVSTGSQEASFFATEDVKHACGITSDGRIYCWGGNLYGQLGTGLAFPDQSRSLTPVQTLMPT